MCFLTKPFAPLPLHIFHLSLCCFLPFWEGWALFYAGSFSRSSRSRSLSRVVAPVPRCSPDALNQLPWCSSQRDGPAAAASTPRAGLRGRRLRFRRSHSETGTAAGEGSGAAPGAPGPRRGAQAGPRGPSPSGAPWHRRGGTQHLLHGAGPRRSPVERRLPSAGLCCWGPHGVGREPSFGPWCRGEGSAADIFAPNPTGSCFPFPRGPRRVAFLKNVVSLSFPALQRMFKKSP